MQEMIKKYFDDTIELMNSVSVGIEGKKVDFFQGVESACRLIKSIADGNKKVLFIGNGGSAAIASHMAVDFWKNGGIKALAFNDSSLLTCLSNDYGYEHVFEKPIGMFAETGDLLFAISSSGCSKNILNSVKAAKEKKCGIMTLSGFKSDNPLRSTGNINYYVDSREYGSVEVVHQFICHFILDMLMKERK